MVKLILILSAFCVVLRFGIANPLINPKLFEGDIVLESKRTLATLLAKKWPNGIIPYEFSANQFTQNEVNIILASTVNLQQQLNANGIEYIRFVPKTVERNYIKFLRNAGYGCASYVGLVEIGEQLISLDIGCVSPGIIQHELLHAIGLWHEQSRPDRDEYVTIYFSNIFPGLENNFYKYTSSVSVYGLPYDYNSLMHYGAFDFAIDPNRPTILPNKPNITIGQRIGPSSLDIEVVRRHYASEFTSFTTRDNFEENDTTTRTEFEVTTTEADRTTDAYLTTNGYTTAEEFKSTEWGRTTDAYLTTNGYTTAEEVKSTEWGRTTDAYLTTNGYTTAEEVKSTEWGRTTDAYLTTNGYTTAEEVKSTEWDRRTDAYLTTNGYTTAEEVKSTEWDRRTDAYLTTNGYTTAEEFKSTEWGRRTDAYLTTNGYTTAEEFKSTASETFTEAPVATVTSPVKDTSTPSMLTSDRRTTSPTTKLRTRRTTISEQNAQVSFSISGSLIIELSSSVTEDELDILSSIFAAKVNEKLQKIIPSIKVKDFKLIFTISRVNNGQIVFRDLYVLGIDESEVSGVLSIKNVVIQAANQVKSDFSSGNVVLPVPVNVDANTNVSVELLERPTTQAITTSRTTARVKCAKFGLKCSATSKLASLSLLLATYLFTI